MAADGRPNRRRRANSTYDCGTQGLINCCIAMMASKWAITNESTRTRNRAAKSDGWKCTATTPSALIEMLANHEMAFKLNARGLFLILTVVCAFSLRGSTLAQDRGWAFTIAWSPDGDTLAIGSSSGLWLFDDAFYEVGFVATPQFKGFAPTTMDWSADGGLIAMANRVFPHSSPGGRVSGDEYPILIVDAVRHRLRNAIRFPRLSAPIKWHPA